MHVDVWDEAFVGIGENGVDSGQISAEGAPLCQCLRTWAE